MAVFLPGQHLPGVCAACTGSGWPGAGRGWMTGSYWGIAGLLPPSSERRAAHASCWPAVTAI